MVILLDGNERPAAKGGPLVFTPSTQRATQSFGSNSRRGFPHRAPDGRNKPSGPRLHPMSGGTRVGCQEIRMFRLLRNIALVRMIWGLIRRRRR
jgi:hypothetical protein